MPSFLIKPKGVQATVTFDGHDSSGNPTGLKITNAGSGYNPSDSLSTSLVSASTVTTCLQTDFLPIINADGQLSGVDTSQADDCSGNTVAITIAAPPAVNSYRSFWYGAT